MSDLVNKTKTELNEFYQKIKTERDELKVKANLAKRELKDVWDSTEEKWSSFQNKYHVIAEAMDDALDDVADGFIALGREIKHAYKDIRKGIDASKLVK